MTASESLNDYVKAIKVSSVLQGDAETYGKQHLFDGNEDTCWNSEPVKGQFIYIAFTEPVVVTSVNIMYQGGFVGTPLKIYGVNGNEKISLGEFEPDDINEMQEFKLSCEKAISKLELIMEDSTDFYGRVTIYHLSIFGYKK